MSWYNAPVRSMTGYGRGHSESANCQVTVEIRSVNHRFLDLKIRGASISAASEEKLRQCIGKSLSRGAVSVSLRIDRQGQAGRLQVDLPVAKRAFQDLEELRETLGLKDEVSLEMVCKQPGVIGVAQATDDSMAEEGACALKASEEALQALCLMRETEGRALQRDVEGRLQTLATLATSLAESAANAPEQVRVRLEERIERLLKNSKVAVDDTRLAQEVAIAADRLDVSEEIVRVRSHLEQLAELFIEEEPVGRRLDFLIQELGREFNTVTSKSQSAGVARLVVEAKAEMEKIREQVQNIE